MLTDCVLHPLWPGRYVLEMIHVEKTPGEFEGTAYEALRHRSTLALQVRPSARRSNNMSRGGSGTDCEAGSSLAWHGSIGISVALGRYRPVVGGREVSLLG